MMMSPKLTILMVLLGVMIVAATQSVFIVDQRQQAIKLLFGRPDGNLNDPDSFIKKPGLHFKIPFVHSVQYFDRRILSVDPPSAQVVIASSSLQEDNAPATSEEDMTAKDPSADIVLKKVSGEPIIVDTFARYKIIDPLQFLKTLRTIDQANGRLENILNNATRTVLGKTSLRDLLSEKRTDVMARILQNVNQATEQDQLGIEIVDVRIVRADLTSDLRASTVRRMISELKERATETRAKGEERALEIRSTANKEREVLLAEAQRDSEIIRGEGDKEAIMTYAKSFNQDRDFYAFYRSTEAYKNALANKDTTLVLQPDSEFFEYFRAID
ncbi:MAG: protease modulator HflC [Rhodospirillales bacterium]|nr:protease modulator HflC [Rhodospirillales bacterium]MCB9965737.1 protease modulator HflC [Rhodospirillales bacterium]MCB9979665.1 protease modulator HflC [Rhodospirillales bacterium]